LDKTIKVGDHFGLVADVKIVLREKSRVGEGIVHFEAQNLIVNTGKRIVLGSLYPTSLNDSLSYAKAGDGGATDDLGLFLKTPTPDLTDLYSPVEIMPIAKISQNLSIPSMVMIASLDNTQGNGHLINEAGFFSGNGDMFNIKVFPGVQKTFDFSIDFEWTIRVI